MPLVWRVFRAMEKIEIIEKEISDVIEIEERAPMWKMPSAMARDFTLILELLKSKGIDCKEAPYARYLDIDWDLEMKKGVFVNFIGMFTKPWHFQAGMHVSSKIEGADNLVCRTIKKQKYVKTIHYGPYQKVGATYKKMYIWAKAQKLSLENESMEFYLNDPKNTEKNSLETMVLIPIANN